MLIKRQSGLEIPSSEITPEALYKSRRRFLKIGAAASASAVLAACGTGAGNEPRGAAPAPAADAQPGEVSATTDELGNALNSFDDITNYNNYYEFSQEKTNVAAKANNYSTSPWQVEVSGLVQNPTTFDMDDLRTMFEQRERIYRLRCVEAWSMVIPWVGFPLSELLNIVEPTSSAKFVRFETVHDPDNMPGQKSPWFPWPYVEGLTVDEAMNDLTLMATGMYGTDLLIQNGAPIRLVVPWKYGFKSIKSIVKIELTDEMPTSLWMASAPSEYGFYANVNPQVNHPRWSQKTERLIGEIARRDTLMFNGYEEQVAHLYDGLDLFTNF